MPDTPDMKALAERYLNLWEEQFSAAAADPALASAMSAWLAPWRAMTGGAVPGASGDTVRKSDGPAKTTSGPARGPQAGTAAAGAAPRDGGDGLDRILERLERIERRLDALERKRAGKAAGSRGSRPPSAG